MKVNFLNKCLCTCSSLKYRFCKNLKNIKIQKVLRQLCVHTTKYTQTTSKRIFQPKVNRDFVVRSLYFLGLNLYCVRIPQFCGIIKHQFGQIQCRMQYVPTLFHIITNKVLTQRHYKHMTHQYRNRRHSELVAAGSVYPYNAVWSAHSTHAARVHEYPCE